MPHEVEVNIKQLTAQLENKHNGCALQDILVNADSVKEQRAILAAISKQNVADHKVN